jgi:YVTN family beta-propeller protein
MKRGTTKTLRVEGILLVIFCLFCAFALLPQPSRAMDTVTATVTVGTSPVGVVVTPDGAYVYVANYGGSVSVISTASNTVTATVTVGSGPWGVAVTPNGAICLCYK